MTTVITFGTFDLFHIGHLRILERASKFGDHLIVGISTDELSFKKKKRYPIINQEQRASIIKKLSFVTDTFFEESLGLKRKYILQYNVKHLVMGDDWRGKFDQFSDICEVHYLPRTTDISTTDIIKKIVKIYTTD
jgi:glycerol-3-phosphate cytidylyltransferase